MKTFKFLLLTILFTACSPDVIEYYDIETKLDEVVLVDETTVDVDTTQTKTPTSPIYQTIYKSSTLNHEWNSGYFNELTMKWDYAFNPSFTYLDYDNDGDMDIFAKVEDNIQSGPVQLNTLYLMINQGNGKWETKLDVIPEQKGVFYRQLMPADIDNDGDMDVVGFIADEPMYGNTHPQTGGVDLFRFEDGIYYYENIVPHEVNNEVWFHGGALADINNDGWVDIIGSSGVPKVYLNKGDGSFDSNDWFEVAGDWFGTKKTLGPAVAMWDLDFVDLNNDGLLDLIGTVNKNKDSFFNHPGNTTNEYQVTTEIYYNTGTYPYYNDNEPYRLDSDYLTDVFEDMFSDVNDHAFIDYNKDGFVDIFTISSTHWAFKKDGVVQYHQNNGDGTFSIHNDIFKEGENELFVSKVTNPTGHFGEGEGGQVWHIKAWDIDNDGDIELLIEGWKYMGFNIWDINSDGKLIQTIY